MRERLQEARYGKKMRNMRRELAVIYTRSASEERAKGDADSAATSQSTVEISQIQNQPVTSNFDKGCTRTKI